MEHQLLFNWITSNLIKRKTINYNFDTSHIRLAFEHDTNEYISNDELNDIMIQLGFHAAGFANDPYLNFNISSESPALQIYQNEVLGHH